MTGIDTVFIDDIYDIAERSELIYDTCMFYDRKQLSEDMHHLLDNDGLEECIDYVDRLIAKIHRNNCEILKLARKMKEGTDGEVEQE